MALLEDRERPLNTTQCVLPADASGFFSVAADSWVSRNDVAPLRDALNEAKGLLDDLDNTAWDRMATDSYYAEYVRRDLRKEFRVELGTVAWAKMYELIVRCQLWPVEDSRSSSSSSSSSGGGRISNGASDGITAQPNAAARPALTVHLCEAPGGFVAATNHFLRTHRPGVAWDWLAVSLNPYWGGNDQYSMVDDDALMRATLPHWCFGADDSGDIRRPPNIAAIWVEARRRCDALGVAGASLVTADGAVDTSWAPHAQELVNASLHFSEIVAALGLLMVGGSLVCKCFTLFEHTSTCSLYLLGCLFDAVSVVKPSTSKPCNSEVYIVARGFRGVPEQVLQLLLSKCGEDVFSERAMFAHELLPPSFLESALDAARHFASCTSEAIRDALDKAGLPASGPTATAIRRVKERFATEWFQRTRLMRLERRFFVAPHEALDGTSNSTSNILGRRRELLGTLAERAEQYRRRRCDLGLDGGAVLAAAAGGASRGNSPGGLGSSPSAGRADGTAGWRGDGGPGELADGGDRGGDGEAAPSPSRLGLKLMAKMGYKEGSGLGRNGQGPIAALSAMGNSARAGLGLASASAGPPPPAPQACRAGGAVASGQRVGVSWAAGACFTPGLGWGSAGSGAAGLGLGASDSEPAAAVVPPRKSWRLVPDAKALLNDRPLAAAEVASWAADAAAATAGHGSSPQHNRAASLLRQQAPPARLIKSKMVVDDSVLVALRRVRDACEAASAATAAHAPPAVGARQCTPGGPGPRSKLCAHTGPMCLAPRRLGAGSAGRAFWKLASLDAALSVCAAAAAASGGAAPHALDLSLRGAGATDFLLRTPATSAPSPGNAGASAGRRSSSCSLPSARSSSDGAAGELDGAGAPLGAGTGASAAPWLCTMLATDAAAAYVQQLGPDERSRLHLQPLAGLAPLPPEALELFTPESCRCLAAAVAASAAPAVSGPCCLVVGDLGSLRHGHCGWPPSSQGPLEGEYDTLYRRRLLWEAAAALGVLVPGGCAVLRLGDSLTMFTASVLYLLHRSFGRVALVKPFASCACSPERFVVAVGRLEDGGVAVGQLLAGLEAVRQVEVAAAGSPAAPVSSELSSPLACAAAGARPEPAPLAVEHVEAASAEPPSLADSPPPMCATAARRPGAAISVAGTLENDGVCGSSFSTVTHEGLSSGASGCTQAGCAPGTRPAGECPVARHARGASQEGPMVLTGVAPLSECVTGEFYRYLAARSQELARRQVSACEAAMEARTRGGGWAEGRPYSSTEEEEHLAIAGQAEAMLAGELMVEDLNTGPRNLDSATLDNFFTRDTQASAQGPGPLMRPAAAACWPRELSASSAGLGFIAAAAGPQPGRSGAPVWASIPHAGHPLADGGGRARGMGFASPRARGGRGSARPVCSGDDGLHRTSSSWRSTPPPASSYGASPPSTFFPPWGAASPSGASTPYGTSPTLGKSPLFGHSLPAHGTSPSPPPHGSSWHARTSAPWGSQHHARQGPGLSSSWDRSGAGVRGNLVGGRVSLDMADEDACTIATTADMPPACGSGISSYGSTRAALSAGGSKPRQGLKDGPPPLPGPPAKHIDGGSWRSSGRWQAPGPVGGPVASRGGSPALQQQAEDEEGWERVVGTGRRRVHQVPRS